MACRAELHIIVPGLCGPLAQIQSLETDPDIRQWLRVLAKAKHTSDSRHFHEIISSLFELDVRGDFPSAALSFSGHDAFDKNRRYMYADPVYLQADMDHAILTPGSDLEISDSESSALCDALNQHFNQDGIDFVILEENRWLLSTDKQINLSTTPILEAVGRNVNFILPKGDDSSYWRQLLTEAQMLMHSHEVNVAREDTGRPVINSLWFHGSGDLSNVGAHPVAINSICSDDPMMSGLADISHCDYLDRLGSADEYVEKMLAYEKHSIHVLHLSELAPLVNYSDVTPWRHALTVLLDQWLYPLLRDVYDKDIDVILYDGNRQKFHFSSSDLLRFWRVARSLLHSQKIGYYVDNY